MRAHLLQYRGRELVNGSYGYKNNVGLVLLSRIQVKNLGMSAKPVVICAVVLEPCIFM